MPSENKAAEKMPIDSKLQKAALMAVKGYAHGVQITMLADASPLDKEKAEAIAGNILKQLDQTDAETNDIVYGGAFLAVEIIVLNLAIYLGFLDENGKPISDHKNLTQKELNDVCSTKQ